MATKKIIIKQDLFYRIFFRLTGVKKIKKIINETEMIEINILNKL